MSRQLQHGFPLKNENSERGLTHSFTYYSNMPAKIILSIIVVACFTMPAIILLMGLLSLPLWLAGAIQNRDNSVLFLLCTIGGSVGIYSIYRLVHYWSTDKELGSLKCDKWGQIRLFMLWSF